MRGLEIPSKKVVRHCDSAPGNSWSIRGSSDLERFGVQRLVNVQQYSAESHQMEYAITWLPLGRVTFIGCLLYRGRLVAPTWKLRVR